MCLCTCIKWAIKAERERGELYASWCGLLVFRRRPAVVIVCLVTRIVFASGVRMFLMLERSRVYDFCLALNWLR